VDFLHQFLRPGCIEKGQEAAFGGRWVNGWRNLAEAAVRRAGPPSRKNALDLIRRAYSARRFDPASG
jgi:hypothetical protein